ncbi:hypothetical protein AAFF_G00042040 [Aldrovandia affinis]|uniref:Uncharacterized protein n=1 Tax=Aldrovandia affinis TaxID=143900 RepID=A0AAD7S2Q9_9TELE|nr:hypothetical protein AAFF_G00042040 [Aldrovandia affinis]
MRGVVNRSTDVPRLAPPTRCGQSFRFRSARLPGNRCVERGCHVSHLVFDPVTPQWAPSHCFISTCVLRSAYFQPLEVGLVQIPFPAAGATADEGLPKAAGDPLMTRLLPARGPSAPRSLQGARRRNPLASDANRSRVRTGAGSHSRAPGPAAPVIVPALAGSAYL